MVYNPTAGARRSAIRSKSKLVWLAGGVIKICMSELALAIKKVKLHLGIAQLSSLVRTRNGQHMTSARHQKTVDGTHLTYIIMF